MAGSIVHLEEDTGLPRTHALVIGVGKYPHLAGGEAPVADSDGMRQLSSPPSPPGPWRPGCWPSTTIRSDRSAVWPCC